MVLRVWDIETGQAIAEHWLRPAGIKLPTDEGGEARVNNVAELLRVLERARGWFSSDGAHFVLTLDADCRVFSVATGKELHSVTYSRKAWHAAMSPDAAFVATLLWGNLPDGRPQHTLEIQTASTGAVVARIVLPPGRCTDLVFSPDARWIAVANRGPQGPLLVYDAATGEERARIVSDQVDGPAMAFSPDSRRIAMTTREGTVLVWDLEQAQRAGAGER